MRSVQACTLHSASEAGKMLLREARHPEDSRAEGLNLVAWQAAQHWRMSKLLVSTAAWMNASQATTLSFLAGPCRWSP
jgi:hypothetical protein